MARIFSIQFTYEGLQHHAMIAARTTPFYNEYSVTMLDESIADLLPNNKIISASKENFAFSDSTKENTPALMHAIISAVVGHLQAIGV
jgi:hypothetical protein